MSLPTTPERKVVVEQNDEDGSASQLHSILRRPNVEAGSSLGAANLELPLGNSKSVSPKSQVRFSIPDSAYLKSDDGSSDQLRSPSRIVFPRDSSETEEEASLRGGYDLSNRGHFVDMHSRVMLDVPEEIWNFHNSRRKGSHTRTRSLNIKSEQGKSGGSHTRRSSLQAVIVETMNSLSSERGTFSRNYSSSLLPMRRPEIFLSPESPLNSYKMPVPLEISLPPYLSPTNKEKKRASVVFDGEGYSKFAETSSSSLEESEESICSAEHDVSFNISQQDESDIDKALGIDEHANVNLKIQKKNLKRTEESSRLPSPNKSSQSLELLSTPYKPIQIPDLENELQPRSTNGTLKFFDEFEPSRQLVTPTQYEEDTLSPGKQRDQLDLNFTFPCVADTADFVKVDPSATSVEFQNRRKNLQRNSALGVKGHKHRRSRSIHNAEDMFVATSTPPKVPERSPLRPKSPTSGETARSTSEASELNDTSSIYDENVSKSQPALDYSVDHENDVDTGNKTEESLKIILERKISDEEDYQPSTEDRSAQKQLTSMHSFREPVNLPEEAEEQPLNYVPLNLLSPRRSLSNIGSQSSRNSEFSRRSPSSSATSQPSEPYVNVPFTTEVKGQKPSYHPKPQAKPAKKEDITKSNGFHSIYEVRNGRNVEILVLDDGSSEDETQTSSTAKVDEKTIANQRKKAVSYEEAMKNYTKILELCEYTATQARSVILHLIEENSSTRKNSYRPPPPVASNVPRAVTKSNHEQS